MQFIIVLCGALAIAQAQEVTFSAPLGDDKGGVQYIGSGIDIVIAGFDVAQGQVYFLSGEQPTLKKFDMSGQLVYAKRLSMLKPAGIKIADNKVYAFDMETNRIWTLACSGGEILDTVQLPDGKINSHWYTCSTIVVEMFPKKKEFDTKSLFSYMVFGLDGEFRRNTGNIYDLNLDCFSQKIVDEGVWFLGRIGKEYCFQAYDYQDGQYTFMLLDEGCEILKRANVGAKVIGQLFHGAPQEHWRMSGDELYILRRREKTAEVVRIRLDALFATLQK